MSKQSANHTRFWVLTTIRRIVQLSVLGMFIGSCRLGWTLFGQPILQGDLSASILFGMVPLADPFAVLQKVIAMHPVESTLIIGGLIVLIGYTCLGGRAFCSWICPMNMVTDAAYSLRQRFGIRNDYLRVHRNMRYAIAVGALIASALTGNAAFEWVSPQAFLWREAIWGIGLGFVAAILGVFALDLLVVSRGWCGHLCPLGAFWCTVGKVGQIKPLMRSEKCTLCGACLQVCPEPQVLNLKEVIAKGIVNNGECTNCGQCAAICPENAITFGLRYQAKPHKQQKTPQ